MRLPSVPDPGGPGAAAVRRLFGARRIGLSLLAVCAAYQVAMGAYFIAFRPALLPEDERAIGASLSEASSTAPGLATWLDRVFAVLGGQAIAAGLLAGLAVWHLVDARRISAPAIALLAGAGLFSVGLMSFINFLIHSDTRWELVLPFILWVAGLACLAVESSSPLRGG